MRDITRPVIATGTMRAHAVAPGADAHHAVERIRESIALREARDTALELARRRRAACKGVNFAQLMRGGHSAVY